MSVLKRTVTVLTVAVGTVGLTFALSGSAWAGSNGRAWSQAWGRYADAVCDLQFVSYGDHFYLNDNLKDGAGCYATWGTLDYGSGVLYNSNGAGTTVHKNYDFPEGTYLSFKVCVRDNGVVVQETCTEFWGQA
ncbi:hypothetical protein [Streptomyces sp. LS1784]|uniref:hypothetical protein n=1 Tax=Streptomyces sp. LS1784 TaxID=2851533 RepID=UPI001CCA10C8|nr:hypothetical protein [Streptomyces sp. LS1784]